MMADYASLIRPTRYIPRSATAYGPWIGGPAGPFSVDELLQCLILDFWIKRSEQLIEDFYVTFYAH
jgi:hypothetical protein